MSPSQIDRRHPNPSRGPPDHPLVTLTLPTYTTLPPWTQPATTRAEVEDPWRCCSPLVMVCVCLCLLAGGAGDPLATRDERVHAVTIIVLVRVLSSSCSTCLSIINHGCVPPCRLYWLRKYLARSLFQLVWMLKLDTSTNWCGRCSRIPPHCAVIACAASIACRGETRPSQTLYQTQTATSQ